MVDFNATQAYLRAGYKCSEETARRQASKLLTKADIQAYLAQKREKHAYNTGITLERTLEEIGRIAYSDITDAISFDDDGVNFKPSSDLPKSVTSAIKKIKMDTTKTIRDSDEEAVHITVQHKAIEQHDKVRALSLLAKYFGMTSDFNQARAALLKYGLSLVPDDESPIGWRLERYAPLESPSLGKVEQAIDKFAKNIVAAKPSAEEEEE